MTETPTATAAEIKIGFSGDEARKAACALELQGGEGRSRSIYFWDSPRKAGDDISLPFLDRGVIFRLRLEDGDQGSKRDTSMTVKLRPCPRLPPDWRKNRKDEDGDWDFTIEEDRTGPAFTPVVAASLQAERKVEAKLVESALRPEPGELGPLLAKPHRHLLEDAAGLKQGDLQDLRPLGPVYTVKWKQDWGTLPDPVVIEEWIAKDLRFLEVSVRTSMADAAEAGKLLEQALRRRNVAPPRCGESKTRAVLTVLARDLAH